MRIDGVTKTPRKKKMSYSEVHDEKVFHSALALCRGSYQRAILFGQHSLSGATLRGKAKRYGGRYAHSAATLMARLANAGLAVREERRAHGKRVVVIG